MYCLAEIMVGAEYREHCVTRIGKYARLDPEEIISNIEENIPGTEIEREFALNTWKCDGRQFSTF